MGHLQVLVSILLQLQSFIPVFSKWPSFSCRDDLGPQFKVWADDFEITAFMDRIALTEILDNQVGVNTASASALNAESDADTG